VSKGGTGGTSPYEALVNLLPSYAGNEGKVLGLSGGTPAWRGLADLLPAYTSSDNGKVLGLDDDVPVWVEQTGGMVPDYANETNLLDSTSAFFPTTINVGDAYSAPYEVTQDGYLYFQFALGSDPTTPFSYHIHVNGNANYVFQTTLNGSLWISTLIAVKAGDSVNIGTWTGSALTVTWHTKSRVDFIPPVAVTPPQLNENYSESEINTGKKWIDGETIYRQVFTGNMDGLTPSGAGTYDLHILAGVATIVQYGGWTNTGGTTYNVRAGIPSVNAADVTVNFVYLGGSGDIHWQSRTVASRTTDNYNDYEIWVEYTKQ
jgi:hypothetical protein